ncbi:MAG: DinB family protein [Gemmatimonadales bacterium]
MARFRSLVGTTLAVLLAGCTPAGQPAAGSETAPASPAADGWGEEEMIAYLGKRIETARDKFLQLADAVPEAEWDYRPMEGVRSFGEVFIHIATDNWAPVWMDLEVGEEAPVGRSMEAFRDYQAVRPKPETMTELERSFRYLLAALAASRGHWRDRVTMGESEWEMGQMWIALTTHMHEHLGQSIAYARANRIVPPWSR